MKASVLIVDYEAGVRSALSGVLRDEGYQVEAGDSGEACLDRIARFAYDAGGLGLWLPGHGNSGSAVRAIKMGAFDFVEKPLSLEKIVLVVGNAVRQRRLEAENRALRASVDRRLTMVGEGDV